MKIVTILPKAIASEKINVHRYSLSCHNDNDIHTQYKSISFRYLNIQFLFLFYFRLSIIFINLQLYALEYALTNYLNGEDRVTKKWVYFIFQ